MRARSSPVSPIVGDLDVEPSSRTPAKTRPFSFVFNQQNASGKTIGLRGFNSISPSKCLHVDYLSDNRLRLRQFREWLKTIFAAIDRQLVCQRWNRGAHFQTMSTTPTEQRIQRR